MKHGGDLGEAAARGKGAGGDWLDLSTGIAPHAYPFAPPSLDAWARLPQSGALAELLAAARRSYGAPLDAPMLAAPGTQIIIQLLPFVHPAAKAAIVGPTYSEHAICWRRSGAEVGMIPELAAPAGAKAVVLVNPNNPDGRSWPPGQVLAVADEMAARGGVLIVDEAFADAEPGLSAAPYTGRDGLIVLRSFGKFFGLAGVRLGFALGPAAIIEKLDAALGPWAVSGPAIEIGTAALADLAWPEAARARYGELAARLDALLTDAGLQIIGGTALFRLAFHAQAGELHAHLASRSIWARRFEDHPRWLRFGLPGTEPAFARLAAALHSFSQSSQR